MLDVVGGRFRVTRPLPDGRAGQLAGLDLDLLGLHPAGDRRVARLHAALEHADDGRQRHLEGLGAQRARRRGSRATPSRTSTVFMPVTTGSPSSSASRIATWKSPESAASLPSSTRS